MNSKDKYKKFCETTFIPLHAQPWWLDAVCGEDHWDISLLFNNNKIIIGALPYYMVRKYGLRFIKMPPLTDYMAIIINYNFTTNSKPYALQAYQQEVLNKLIKLLPKVSFYYQQFYPEFNNWLPFYWQGFHQTTMYTYTLDRLSDINIVFSNFKSELRTSIRKAEKQLKVETSEDLAAFYQINCTSFEHNKKKPPYQFETLKKVNTALTIRNQKRIYLAKDIESGVCQAGLYVAYDARKAYFLLWGIDRRFAEQRALQLIFWQAIQDFSGIVEEIDFCGSVIPSIERFIRSFGASPKPCLNIYKASNKLFKIMSIIFNKAYI